MNNNHFTKTIFFILLFQHHSKLLTGKLLILALILSHVFLLFFMEFVCANK